MGLGFPHWNEQENGNDPNKPDLKTTEITESKI
jgi:hypothetical protein